MHFKKDFFSVLSSRTFNVMIMSFIGFLIPYYLSIEQYSYLETFNLYIAFIGILHFGFIDGLYIKYGGKSEKNIDKRILKGERKFFILFQTIISFIFLILAIILNDNILIAFSLVIIPINIQTMYKLFYQAVGEFKYFSKILLINSYLTLLINLLIIFVIKEYLFWPFVIGVIIINYTLLLFLEFNFFVKYKNYNHIIHYKEIFNHFKVGIFIMIGNLSITLIYNLDRWFVKLFLTVKDFSFYSFAVSILMVINVLINSLTMVFYPYLSRGIKDENIVKIKNILIVVGSLFSGTYFIFEIIITILLSKYLQSLEIIQILFLSFPAMIVINVIFINLYKAKKQEKRYLSNVLLMLCITFILNSIAIFVFPSTVSLSIATTFAIYIWYIFSSRHFSYLKPDLKEFIYLMIYVTIYYICNNLLYFWWGVIGYYVLLLILIVIFYKKELFTFVSIVLGKTTDF